MGHVLAAADGTVRYGSCSGGQVLWIDHAGGWRTSYYHVTGVRVTNGQIVHQGDWIANVGTAAPCGGNASGAQLHFSLWKNGAPYPLDGMSLGGWTIHQGSSAYLGSWTRDSDGYTYTVGSDGYMRCSCISSDGTPGGSTAEGSYVGYRGFVYRVVGGAPVYVSSWDAVGGPQPVTQVSDQQFGSLARYPADGTTVSTASGAVYVFAGGAPVYVSNWDAVGGPRASMRVDQAALDHAGTAAAPWDHVLRYPADGTTVSVASGAVFVFAGGAPIYVSSWDAIGGSRPSTRVDQAALDHAGEDFEPWRYVRRYPADGTAVSVASGAVFVFAGGAPMYVSRWDAIGGPRGTTRIDQAALDHAGQDSYPWRFVRRYPSDGTTINVDGGPVYVFAGGAPIFVSNWAAVGGERPSTRVDQAALDHAGEHSEPWRYVRRYPADGTVLDGAATDHSWTVADGHPEAGPRVDGVTVDEAAIRNAGLDGPWRFLRSAPEAVHDLTARVNGTKRKAIITWTAPLAASAIETFSVRLRMAGMNWTEPSKWRQITTTSLTRKVRQGQEMCFQVATKNRAEQTSKWSAAACVDARPRQ